MYYVLYLIYLLLISSCSSVCEYAEKTLVETVEKLFITLGINNSFLCISSFSPFCL